MPIPATTREQRLRKTKAQLIDEIDTLEQRGAAIEAANRSGAPMRAKAGERYLADQQLAHLARFPSENPNPVLRAMPDGAVLYANDAAIAVKGLLKGRKKSTLARDLASVVAEASRAAEVRETAFESGDRVFAFSIAPVAGESYINIYGRDVTDEHNTRLALEAANEASAAAEARLMAIIDNSPATICLKDAKGRYQLVNKHFTELHGTTAEAVLGKTAHELFPKEIADPFRSHDRRVLRTGVAEEREQVVTTPGGPRIFNEIKFPIATNGEQGTVNAIGLIATDITERKRAEQALRDSEAWHRTLLDAMNEGVRVIQDGVHTFANQRFCEMTGYSREELIGAPSESIFDAENLEIVGQQHKLRERGESGSYEVSITAKDGRAIPVILSAHPLFAPDGRFEGSIGVFTDITERKRAEEAMRENEQLLATVLDNMPAQVYLRDLDGRFELINKNYAEVHGVTKEQVRGRTLHDIFAKAVADDYGRLDAEIVKQRRGLEQEVTVPLPDGEHVIAVAQFPVFDLDGEVIAVGGVDVDITERKRAEEALHAARARAVEANRTTQLLQDVAVSANEAAVAGDAIKICLDEVCAHTGWPVGHAYRLADDGTGELVPTKIWHLDRPARFRNFRRVTEKTRFASGKGLPGRVLASRQPAWIVDVTKDRNFPRAKLAKDIGVKAGFAFPVMVGRNVVAVLEFYATQAAEPDASVMEVMAHVGTQLGRVIERERAEQALKDSTERFRAVSESANDAIVSIDAGGRVVFWNEGAEKTFGYSGDEIVGKPLTKIMPKSYRQRHLAGIKRHRRSGKHSVVGRTLEFEGLRKDGSVFPVELSIATWTAGGDRFYTGILRDITERKTAEDALRASVEQRKRGEQFLRTVVDAIPAHISIRDADGRYVLTNKRLADHYGIDSEDTLGKLPHQVYPPSPADVLEEQEFRKVIATGVATVDSEYEYGGEGGNEFRLTTRQPIHGDDGRLLYILTVSHDITERKRVEQALKEGEALFNTGARIANLGHWVWDEVTDKAIHVSEEVARIHGVTVEEFLAAATSLEAESKFVHPDDREEYVRITGWLEPGDTYDLEYRIVRPDGEIRHVRELGEKILDDAGRHVRTVGTQQDVTDQKKAAAEFVVANAALKESEERYALAMNGSNEGLWDWDLRSNEIYISPHVAMLLGVDADSHTIGPDEWDAAIHPDDIEGYDVATQAHHRGESAFYTCEYRVRGRDGVYRWVHDRGLGLRDETGKAYRMAGSLGDITQRKEAEEALRQNQALFDQAARLASLGHWAYDEVADKVIHVSDEVARIHGVTVEEHLAGLSSTAKDIERAHPDDREKLGRVLRQAQRDATAYDVEYRIVRPDGEVRYVRELGEPVLDDDGKLIRSFGTLQDITERKRAEQALRDSRELLHAVIDAVPAMINAKDRDSRYLIVNRYQAELYGVSTDEAIGKTAGNLLGRKYGAHTRRLDRKVIDSGEALPYFEEDHVDAHGVHRQLLATKVPLMDRHDRVQGVVTVALDITDRKRAEQALKESETRFMQAARLANLGHWAWDEFEDRCTYCSEELARIHGVTVDEYLAATNSVEGDLARIHPDDRDEYNRATRKWAGRHDTYDVEYRIVRPDGEVRYVRELAEAIRDETGRMVRSIGTKQDITVAKQAERELLEAKRRTEEANNLVIEKNQMLESLSSKLSKYLSPQIYASIFSGEQSVEITSQRKKMTVFFSDIADFTESTDALESEELTSLLNQYLTEMSKIALDFGATIDKFVGDAIMLFLGDPDTKGVKQDAVACVKMAIAMQRRMRELQSEWRDRGMEHPFQLRIGINTGYCTVGNFGSEDRMDYTIIGNEVNLAARLQTHAELGDILIANETYSLVKDVIQAEEQSPIKFKGFAHPVRTFRVKGIYDDLIAEGRIIRTEQDGLKILLDLEKHDKADAIKAIEEVLAKLKE